MTRPCTHCGGGTKATDGLCSWCRYYDARPHLTNLPGGHWEQRGLIQVWVPKRPPIDPARLVACPTCYAHIHQPCQTRSGRARANHATRLVSRRCPCGSEVQGQKQYCPPCRAVRRQETRRSYYERQRSVA